MVALRRKVRKAKEIPVTSLKKALCAGTEPASVSTVHLQHQEAAYIVLFLPGKPRDIGQKESQKGETMSALSI